MCVKTNGGGTQLAPAVLLDWILHHLTVRGQGVEHRPVIVAHEARVATTSALKIAASFRVGPAYSDAEALLSIAKSGLPRAVGRRYAYAKRRVNDRGYLAGWRTA